MKQSDVCKCVYAFLSTMGILYAAEPLEKNVFVYFGLLFCALFSSVSLRKGNYAWLAKCALFMSCMGAAGIAESFFYLGQLSLGVTTICIWAAVLWVLVEVSRSVPVSHCCEKTLFPSRKNDWNRWRAVLLAEPDAALPGAVGLLAKWGDGKSFFMDVLLADCDIQRTFYTIRLNVIALNMDHVPSLLIEELRAILKEEGIPAGTLSDLRRVFQWNSNMTRMSELLFPTQKFCSSIFQSIATDVQKLSKRVLLVFDDVDRIQNIETFMNLASIADELARNTGGKIQVLYQYDREQLLGIGERPDFMKELLTKYVSQEIWLSPVSFDEMVEQYLVDCKKRMLPQGTEAGKVDWSETISNICMEVKIRLDSCADEARVTSVREKMYSARRVLEFVNDLWEMLDAEHGTNINCDIIGVVVYVRHFLPEAYRNLRVASSLYESMYLTLEDGRKIFAATVEVTSDVRISWMKDDNEEKYVCSQLLELPKFAALFTSSEQPKSMEKAVAKGKLECEYDQLSHIVRHLIYSNAQEEPSIACLVGEVKKDIRAGKALHIEALFERAGVLAELRRDWLTIGETAGILFHIYSSREESKEAYLELLDALFRQYGTNFKGVCTQFRKALAFMPNEVFLAFSRKLAAVGIPCNYGTQKWFLTFVQAYGRYVLVEVLNLREEWYVESSKTLQPSLETMRELLEKTVQKMKGLEDMIPEGDSEIRQIYQPIDDALQRLRDSFDKDVFDPMAGLIKDQDDQARRTREDEERSCSEEALREAVNKPMRDLKEIARILRYRNQRK